MAKKQQPDARKSYEGRVNGSDEWLHGEDIEDETLDNGLRAVLDRMGAYVSDVTTTPVTVQNAEDHAWRLKFDPDD